MLFSLRQSPVDPFDNSSITMLFFLLISSVSFVIIFKTFTSKPLTKLVPIGFWGKLLSLLISWLQKSSIAFSFFEFPLSRSLRKKVSEVENDQEEEGKVSLLDLPELALECILDHLSPAELCNMAAVCSYLRDRCRSDYLWEKHMQRKWGKVFGGSAYRQWREDMASENTEKISVQRNQKGIFASLRGFGAFLWIKTKSGKDRQSRSSLPDDSIMALYLYLEKGKFWFPAQVYNRENGHVGFTLSCYDARLCYDSRTDTFQARYTPHVQWITEENIQWDRLRIPPIDISSHVLHISDCLDDLRPGDHFEVQWRRNEEYPYGWWYGIIGHLESCQGHGNHCHCQDSDMLILEFNQYAPGSRWRRQVIDRKHHSEEGNGVYGFYGGIRKLHNEEEITRWKNLWPTKILE